MSTFLVSAVVDHDTEWFIIGCRVEFNEDVTLIEDASGAAANREFDEVESCCLGEDFNGRVEGILTARMSVCLTDDRR